MSELGRCTYEKNIDGTLYRLTVSTSRLEKSYSGKFIVCLKDKPGSSVNCTVNEKTKNIYPVQPPYPDSVLVGTIFMIVFTAFICGITVRSYIIWYKID